MKKLFTILSIFLVVITKSQSTSQLSESFLQKLIKEQFDSCQIYFDTSITDKINAGMMEKIWGQLSTMLGNYQSYENIRTEKDEAKETVYIQCNFEKTKLDLKFVYNEYHKVIGLTFVPPKSKTVYAMPDYFEPTKFYESKLSVKTGSFEMPGILCLPNRVTNPPVVILLAGSGPNDKDETGGPLKPLKDIAIGLAANGIASLRYDKRTLTYGSNLPMDKTGINEEVIEDALSAVRIIRAHETTKTSKIIIAGHSLGAMCAPLIASLSKDINAIIIIAGNARTLEDVVLDQYIYFSSLDTSSTELKNEIEKLKKQNEIVKNPKALKKADAKNLPLGAPSFYWQSLKKYDQVKVAKSISQPILILQGERDYQVTMKEFDIWKKELSNNPKNQFKTYPLLNHRLTAGTGTPSPAEYDIPGNVDYRLIEDMVAFINASK